MRKMIPQIATNLGYELFFDGSCEPVNPGGTARWAIRVLLDGQEEYRASGVCGTGPEMSCNVAEYYAAAQCIEYVARHRIKEATVYGDSLIVSMKLTARKISHGLCESYSRWALNALNSLPPDFDISFRWIPREQNMECDAMSKA